MDTVKTIYEEGKVRTLYNCMLMMIQEKNATAWFRMIEFDIKFSFGTKR